MSSDFRTYLRRAAAVLCALALPALAISAAAQRGSDTPAPDLRLLFTGSLEGFLEPCGCTAGRIGGMDRMVTTLRDQQANAKASVYVDCGDTFADGMELTATQRTQLPMKGAAMLSIMASVGCEGLAVGDYDLVLGVEALRKLSKDSGIPFLSANLYLRGGELVFEPYVIVERNGLSIGIFALLGDKVIHPDPLNTGEIDVSKFAESIGCNVKPWRPIAKNIAAALRPRVDVLVCASHLGAVANLELAELCPEIDVICGPHADQIGQPYRVIEGTLVSYTQQKGTRPTRFDLWWGDRPLRKAQGFGRGLDQSQRGEAEAFRDIAIQALRNLIGREGLLPPGEADRLRDTHRGEIERRTALLAEAGAFPKERSFAVVLPTVHRNLVRDEAVLERLDAYHEEVHEFWKRRRTGPGPTTEEWPSPSDCASCHPEQYEFWKSTRHSRAYSTLAITRQQYDADCFYCHTVGFGEPGGFKQPAAAAHFENVQCAACHGSGALHMSGGASYIDDAALLPIGSTCLECHNHEHDPEFHSWAEDPSKYAAALEAKILKVACPKMAEAGAGNDRFDEALRNAAEALVAGAHNLGDPGATWAEVTRLLVRAGSTDTALVAARRAVEVSADPGGNLRVLALLLVEAGELEEADRVLVRALEVLPLDPVLHFTLARLRLATDAESALVHAREAYSLAPTVAPHVEAVARALVATGAAAEAAEFVRGHVDKNPDQAELLAPLLAELR